MAAPPVLLVADDLSVIASVKRVLAREGYECVLATNAADAVIAWGHLLPGLILLQPSVESDRGSVVLEELRHHPDAQLVRVVLLGETIPGFGFPVVPLPLDPESFAETIDEQIRSTQVPGWSVLETAAQSETTTTPALPSEPEAWRATSPTSGGMGATLADADDEVPEVSAVVPEPSPPHHLAAATDALEERLFGDLAADVEADAMQNLESSLPQPADDELRRLEDDVRAEAQRRRQAREARVVEVKPAPPTPPPAVATNFAPAPEAGMGDEASFADLSDTPSAPPSRAAEVLERAQQMVLETRAQGEAQRRVEEADLRRTLADLETNTRRAERAEELVRTEREARQACEEANLTLKEDLRKLGETLETERQLATVRAETAQEAVEAERAQRDAAARRDFEREREQRSQVEDELETTRRQVRDVQAQLAAATAKITELELIASAASEENAKRHEIEAVLATRTTELEASQLALQRAKDDADAALALASEVEAERQRLQETRSELQKTQQLLDEARQARDQSQAEYLRADEEREALQERTESMQAQLDEVQAEKQNATEAVAEREARLSSERAAREALEAAHASTAAALEETKTQAEKLEATAQLAQEKVKALEAREIMSLAVPGRAPVGIARHGSVGLDGLAHVVSQLVIGNAEARLELSADGGVRRLWFRRGQVIAAESTARAEGLLSRARRDGLIDGRQEGELRMVEHATPREQLEALRTRQFLRDVEVVPLVQRYTEQVALDAFTEPETQYRLVDEPPGAEVLLATVPRPTLPMLAESLRRAVPPEALLERLGGGESIAVATDSELDLRALGFSERERKMLSWVDGEATIEDLSLASGLKPDASYRALLVARLLGIIDVKPGRPRAAEPTSGELDVRRLEAKFDEIQEADYFTILGLSRAAGGEDVRRAFQRLTQEFDPLRFSGHPDPVLQQRAQIVSQLLDEAARALEDDRRRAEYARHLLD